MNGELKHKTYAPQLVTHISTTAQCFRPWCPFHSFAIFGCEDVLGIFLGGFEVMESISTQSGKFVKAEGKSICLLLTRKAALSGIDACQPVIPSVLQRTQKPKTKRSTISPHLKGPTLPMSLSSICVFVRIVSVYRVYPVFSSARPCTICSRPRGTGTWSRTWKSMGSLKTCTRRRRNGADARNR